MTVIAVDSASDMDLKMAEELGVTLVPMQIRIGDEDYLDGVDLSHETFYHKLIESADLPQTSQINEYRWSEVFAKLTGDGDTVIAITISSKLSGTYSSAVKAAKAFGGRVLTVDSLNAGPGEHVLVMYAIRLLNEGLPAEEIVLKLNAAKSRIQLLAVLDTLKYLKKGGRISSVAAFTGELLSIKPVISIVKGEVKLIGKAMGSKKGNNLLMQLADRCGGIDFDMPYCLAYSGLSDTYLQKYLADSERLWKGKTDDIPVYMLGSTIGTHVGPGAIAVTFFAKE